MTISFLIIFAATLITAFDRKCPDTSQWQLHGRAKCPVERNYICLLHLSNKNSSWYEEFCGDEDKSELGGRLVLRPFKDFAECSLHRYQPFVFTTAGNNDCVYQKSKCNEAGQVVFNDGTLVIDTLCQCDKKNGYTFVTKPTNSCYCIPSEEDCSCYKMKCSDLLTGFNCTEISVLNFTTCEENETAVFTEYVTVFSNQYEHHNNILHQGQKYRIIAAIITLGMICIACTIGITWNIKGYFKKPRILLKQPSGIAFSGQTETVQIECKIESKLDILDVKWQRDDNNKILENGDKYCFKKDHDATLTIHEVNPNDAGSYACIVRNCIGSSKSNEFTLTIKDLKEAEEIRHYVRVIVIGKEGVGKSSLMKRLLWKGPDDILNIPTTDGIDISITECEIDVENGKWMPYNDATDYLVQRFERALASHTKTENKTEDPSRISSDHSAKTQLTQIDPNELNQQLDEQRHLDKGANIKQEETRKITNPDLNTENEQDNTLSKTIPNFQTQHTTFSFVINEKNNESLFEINSAIDITEKDIDDAVTAFLNSVKDKHATNTNSKKTASCWLGDFAGQTDFYATHQAFLSSCAIYLLVADITDDIKKQPSMSEEFQHAGDYVDFWLNNIHCYWSKRRENVLDPPVIVVCSKDDKLKSENQAARQQEKQNNLNFFFNQLSQRFRNKPAYGHIREVVSISNVEDTEATFDELRKKIFKQAREMKDWGRQMPLRWIFLEMILQKMKEANVNVTTYTKLETIARNKIIGITQKNELDMFLQTQHDIGNIIYFANDNLKDNIIINPKWLVQAFRCLISGNIDPKIKKEKDWVELCNTGKMTETLLCQLLSSKKEASDYDFMENISHLIEVMKQFDILVQLRNKGLSGNLYMPCMVKACDLENVIDKLGSEKTSWLCFEFDFLPSAFFNHVMVFFIKKYNVTEIWNERGNELAIYRHFVVFDLDDTRNEKIVLCVSRNIIGIEICTSKPVSNISTNAADIRAMVDNFIKTLKQKYCMKINHKLSLKCNSVTFATDRLDYLNEYLPDKLRNTYYCAYHCTTHDVVNVVFPWALDFAQVRQLQKELKLQRKKQLQQKKRVYIIGSLKEN